MTKHIFLILIAIGVLSGCSKEKLPSKSRKLYSLSLNQIKKSLMGSWDLKSACNTTIAGTDCQNLKNESLVFTDKDSLLWTKDNEIVTKDQIEFIRIKAPEGQGYESDSIYTFKILEKGWTYVPYDIIHDSLIIQSATKEIDAGFTMILTRSK